MEGGGVSQSGTHSYRCASWPKMTGLTPSALPKASANAAPVRDRPAAVRRVRVRNCRRVVACDDGSEVCFSSMFMVAVLSVAEGPTEGSSLAVAT